MNQILGDENYNEYLEYKRSIPTRAFLLQLEQFGFSSDEKNNDDLVDMIIEGLRKGGLADLE